LHQSTTIGCRKKISSSESRYRSKESTTRKRSANCKHIFVLILLIQTTALNMVRSKSASLQVCGRTVSECRKKCRKR
jgi:hypothetical protein